MNEIFKREYLEGSIVEARPEGSVEIAPGAYLELDAKKRKLRELPILQKKPMFATDCNHCGLCCATSLCKLGERIFDRADDNEGPCPALLRVGNSYFCNVIHRPESYRDVDPLWSVMTIEAFVEYVKFFLGAGKGCGMVVDRNDWLAFIVSQSGTDADLIAIRKDLIEKGVIDPDEKIDPVAMKKELIEKGLIDAHE